jgi:hypothetical protein
MTTTIIRGHQEETDCGECGWPMYSGDYAFSPASDPLSDVYCSAACLEKGESR